MNQPADPRVRLPRPSILVLAIAGLALLPFAASLGGWFIYDDITLIVGNELVRELRLRELWTTEFFYGVESLHFRYFRPLVTTSWALDWALWGGNAAGFHAANLLLHAAVSCLVFTTLRRWTERDGAAFLGTLLWAWHPTKTEAVVWISGRTDLLCALGLLLATTGAARRLRGIRSGWALETLGIAVAFVSKESAVVLPGLIAVEAWVAEGRAPLDLRVVGRSILKALPHGAIAGGYIALRVFLLPIEPTEFAQAQSLRDTVLFTIETWGEIAKALFWPWPLTMHRAPVRIDDAKNFIHDPIRLGLGSLAVVLLAASTAFFARRRPMLVVGLLLATFLLIPVANLRPTRMPVLFAERFLYLPSLGIAFAAASLLPRRLHGFGSKAIWPAAFVALLGAVIASASHTENLLDDRRLWAHELEVHPNLSTAIQPKVQQTYAEGRFRESLELSARGYAHAKSWTISHPFDVEFALSAAQAYEALTLDNDTATLENIATFYRAFFIEKARAELDTGEQVFVTHGGTVPAAWFRKVASPKFARFQVIGARALARAGDCERALVLARDARDRIEGIFGLTTASLVLARCGAWDEALALVAKLPANAPPRIELENNLRISREALEQLGDARDLDSALHLSRIGTLLLDRRMAFSALADHGDELVADPRGALYFARAAWAAGEDDAARAALGRWMPPSERDEQLAVWSRELGRE